MEIGVEGRSPQAAPHLAGVSRGSFVIVVRHADAGDRERWKDDDALRPLTKKGRRQAEGLVAALVAFPITRVLSSPYARCVQTVEPLAAARGIAVEEAPELAEGNYFDSISELLDEPSAVVACTHGDVIYELLNHLLDGGLIEPAQARQAKGSAWILRSEGGRIRDARYLPPAS